jgi:Sec7-like guanine-nucleotide exchange factor
MGQQLFIPNNDITSDQTHAATSPNKCNLHSVTTTLNGLTTYLLQQNGPCSHVRNEFRNRISPTFLADSRQTNVPLFKSNLAVDIHEYSKSFLVTFLCINGDLVVFITSFPFYSLTVHFGRNFTIIGGRIVHNTMKPSTLASPGTRSSCV